MSIGEKIIGLLEFHQSSFAAEGYLDEEDVNETRKRHGAELEAAIREIVADEIRKASVPA